MGDTGGKTVRMGFGQVVRLIELLVELDRRDDALDVVRSLEPQMARIERAFSGLATALAELAAKAVGDEMCSEWLAEELARAQAALAEAHAIAGEKGDSP